MPEPGKHLRRKDSVDQLEPDFREHLQAFVEMTLYPVNIVTKKFNSVELTGHEFKEYVNAWSELDWNHGPNI